MVEAVRKKDLYTYRGFEGVESLPVASDPLPVANQVDEALASAKLPTQIKNRHSDNEKYYIGILDDVVVDDGVPSKDRSTASDLNTYFSFRLLAGALDESISEESKPSGKLLSSASPLMTAPFLNETPFEYSLPHYDLSELKNFYSNQSADMIESLENDFLNEVCYDIPFARAFNEYDDLELTSDISKATFSNEHPLLHLISTYAQNLLAWKSSKGVLDRRLQELSDTEKAVWKVEKNRDILRGRCRDNYEVSLTYEYEIAELDRDQLSRLDCLQKELRLFLLEQVAMNSFKVATSRLQVESYLIQVLKQCPVYEKFSKTEPIVLLPDSDLDEEIENQITQLREITSVLFTSLRHLTLIDIANKGRVPHLELIDNHIDWIMCITGRLIRQCRLKDHVYVAMQLLRVPFSLTYTPSHGGYPLCALLQPPALDMAWFRVGGRLIDFLAEPEVEIRGALLVLCLRTPKKRFNFNRLEDSDQCITTVLSESDVIGAGSKTQWTVVDSDGESDIECSANFLFYEKSSQSSPLSPRLDMNQDLVDVESVCSLIDQIDVLGLIEFLFSHDDNIGDPSVYTFLFAFANWFITALEGTADFLHSTRVDTHRFQRQIVKQITEITGTLLSRLRLSIERAIILPTNSSQLRLFSDSPNHNSVDDRVVLAQYDELCLRLVGFLLSNAASVATRLTCWRRLARMGPFRLFSSRAKLRLYLLLISSISKKAGDAENEFFGNKCLAANQGTSSSDNTKIEEGKMGGGEVVALLRAALIDPGCLVDPFIMILGQFASQECRPPPMLNEEEKFHPWLFNGIPVVERLLVERVLDILFGLYVVPALQLNSEKGGKTEMPSGAIPMSTACGRDQIVAIVSLYPFFAFQHLLNLIITSADQLDTRSGAFTKVSCESGLKFSTSSKFLLDLVGALPQALFIPDADNLDKLLSWIGGYTTGELLPLASLRSRVSRKLLSKFPWEEVNNTTRDYLISTQTQSWVAVAVATAFQRHILGSHHRPLSKFSEALSSYVKSVLPSFTSHSRRSCSLSPPRIPSSGTTNHPLPFHPEAVSFYHWTMRLIFRLHLKPSTETLSRLLKDTDLVENPLTIFLTINFQLRRIPRPTMDRNRDICRALLELASSGHFALAIEAFSRLSVCYEEEDEEGEEKRKSPLSMPCEAFTQFLSCILKSDKAEAVDESLWAYLWGKWKVGWWGQGAKNERAPGTPTRGPVLEAFLGAVMNAIIGYVGVEEKYSLLRAVVSSTLVFLLTSHSCYRPQAIWLLEKLFKTAFWIEKSFPASPKTHQITEWWQKPIVRILHPSLLKKLVDERSSFSCKLPESSSHRGLSSLHSPNYNAISSSWAEGLPNFMFAEGLRNYLPYSGSAGAPSASDVFGEDAGFVLLQNLLGRASEDDEVPFWLIAYLIGAECNPEDIFGGYNLWDDVVATITWNRSTLLAEYPSTGGSGDVCDAEKCILSAFIDSGLLSCDVGMEGFSMLTRHLPLVQAVSALNSCPFHHPAFFLLLQLVITHCFVFSNKVDGPSTPSSEICFPPGFLLLQGLPWYKHNLTIKQNTDLRMSVFDVLLCRLREALRYWLKRDSQGDIADPYGLYSSNAVSLLRITIGLLSDLEQTMAHRTFDTLSAHMMLERIRAFDVKSALQSVNLDCIASTIYAEIDRWHFLRGTHKPLKGSNSKSSNEPLEGPFDQPNSKYSMRRLGPPNIQQYRFDECSIYGPRDLRLDSWHTLTQACIESIKSVAWVATERDKHLERLHRQLREGIIPNLYKTITCHQSELVECQPLIHLPLISPRACSGSARITHDFRTARLESAVEADAVKVRQSVNGAVRETWNAALQTATTVSCRQISSVSDLPPSVPRGDGRNNGVFCGSPSWVFGTFRLVSLIQRMIRFRTENVFSRAHDSRDRLIDIFYLLCQNISVSTSSFLPAKIVLSQCVDMMAANLLASGDCRYNLVLDAMTNSPQLLQLLSNLWPNLLEASLQAKPESRVKHFLAVYHHLPLIVRQCGAQVAHDLLRRFPSLPDEEAHDVLFHSSSSKSPTRFGDAAQLDILIADAFQCLVEISDKAVDDAGVKALIELIRDQVISYFDFNFPHTVIRLLDTTSNVGSSSTQEELWHLTKVSVLRNCSIDNECQLSTEDLKSFLHIMDHLASSAYSTNSLFVTTKSNIIECLGLLNQQLAVKLSRSVELDHLTLSQAHEVLMENFLTSFWSRVIGIGASSAAEILQSGVRQLTDLIVCIYKSQITMEPPQLFHAFVNSFVENAVGKPTKLSEVDLLYQINQTCATLPESHGLPKGFPWSLWQPTTSVLSSLVQFVDELIQSVYVPAFMTLSYMLSCVFWDVTPKDVNLVEYTDNLVRLVVSIVCCYDNIRDNEGVTLCSEKLQRFIEGCRTFLVKHHRYARLSPCDLEKVKTNLRPNVIIITADAVFVEFFRFLSLASHMGENPMETSESFSTLLCILSPEKVAPLRRAFLNLCVDMLLAVGSPTACEALPHTSPNEEQTVEPPATAASRACSLLMTSVLPAASNAVGAVLSSVSSSSVWKHVFGERQNDGSDMSDAFEKLISSEVFLRDFAWRILRLLNDLESCCAAECWGGVNSEAFEEAVGYCEELLRLRSINRPPSNIVDATFLYWMSERRSDDSNLFPVSAGDFREGWTNALCRPLLQALLRHLSISDTMYFPSSSVTISEQATRTRSYPPFMTVVTFVDKCLWLLLRTNCVKSNLAAVPTDFKTRMTRISDIFCDNIKTDHQKSSLSGGSGSWLVPACLFCKKLLPLFVHAHTRWRCIFNNRCISTNSSPPTSDSPVILLADITHWFTVLDLCSSDVCAEICNTTSQLSGLLLLLHLSLAVLVLIDESTASDTPQAAAQISALLNCFHDLFIKLEKSTYTAQCQVEINFVIKFCEMVACVIELVEEWQATRQHRHAEAKAGTRVETSVLLAKLRERKHKWAISGREAVAVEAARSAVRALLVRLDDCKSIDNECLLSSFTFLCHRLWFPLPDFVDALLSSHPALPSSSI